MDIEALCAGYRRQATGDSRARDARSSASPWGEARRAMRAGEGGAREDARALPSAFSLQPSVFSLGGRRALRGRNYSL